MAKEISANTFIKSANDLITSKGETRAGFIAMALEKNYMAVPYINEAKALKSLASHVKKPKDLLQIKDIQFGLLTASGLSDKSMNYLTEDDKKLAILGLIEKFLEPTGKNFIDELIYRYLLIKGDALGGRTRNLAGTLGERKFLRMLLSVLNITGINYKWKDSDTNTWFDKSYGDTDIEKRIKAIYWNIGVDRLLVLNINVPIVDKNVDISLLLAKPDGLINGKQSIIHQPDKYIALGELKGGIDPAGADEHWKTANSALDRIRKGFLKQDIKPFTFFIGAAIENSMADEIFNQLKSETMNNAANLTNDQQLTNICNWIVHL